LINCYRFPCSKIHPFKWYLHHNRPSTSMHRRCYLFLRPLRHLHKVFINITTSNNCRQRFIPITS